MPIRSNVVLSWPIQGRLPHERLCWQINVGMVKCVGRLMFKWSTFWHIRPTHNSNARPSPNPNTSPKPDGKVWDIDVDLVEQSPAASRPLNTIDLAEMSTFWESTSRESTFRQDPNWLNCCIVLRGFFLDVDYHYRYTVFRCIRLYSKAPSRTVGAKVSQCIPAKCMSKGTLG